MKKNIIILAMLLLFASLNAQDKSTSIINYAPNSNFMALKVKNVKEIKTKLENHPLKKLIYNDNTKEFIDELISLKDKNDDDEEDDEGEEEDDEGDKETSKEAKELENVSIDKFFASLNGEAIISLSCENFEKIDDDKNLIGSFIAQVDQDLFQEFIKADIAYEEKSSTKKTIAKKQFENIEYVSITTENESSNSFTAYINGMGVLSNNEAVFKKILVAISKKSNYENGLKSNEKIYSFISKNQNKDILFYADFSQLFENMLKEEPDGPGKISLTAMKFEKLFEINASFDLNEKADSFDITLKGLDDGFLQFATFINSEFTPSPFVSSEISGYSRLFFSIPELKKKIIALATKIDPNFSIQYQNILTMAKTNFQIDIDGFLDSMGDDMEAFSFIKENVEDEGILLGKLKNPAVFITNLSSILNNPFLKQTLDAAFTIVENKESGNQFWSLTSKGAIPNQKPISLAVGNFDSYAFITNPAKMAQKHIALSKKTSDSKLSSLAGYNNARAMFPAKIAGFSFTKTKDMMTSIKSKFLEQKETFKILPSMDKILKLLEEINPEDFKGNLIFGIWKETNQITISTKLTSTEK